MLNRPYSEEINVTFENVLNFYIGPPVTIFTGVTVNLGSLSGQTIVTIDEDYNNYTGEPFFSQLSGTPVGSTYEIIVIPFIPTPTPTPTFTSTPTPTSTNTPTPTSTSTPTPTQTPIEVLINPIITENDEYINVGDNFYLMFVDPITQPFINPLLIGENQYLIIGENEYLEFINPI